MTDRWPALMSPETAARYLEVGETTFRILRARAGLEPVKQTYGVRLTRFARVDLDGLIDRMRGLGASFGHGDSQEPPADAVAAPASLDEAKAQAVKRIRRRAESRAGSRTRRGAHG